MTEAAVTQMREVRNLRIVRTQRLIDEVIYDSKSQQVVTPD